VGDVIIGVGLRFLDDVSEH